MPEELARHPRYGCSHEHRAVTPDFNGLITQHFAKEYRYRTLTRVCALTFTEGVRQTQNGVIQAVQPMEKRQVFFDRQLRNSIRTHGSVGCVSGIAPA